MIIASKYFSEQLALVCCPIQIHFNMYVYQIEDRAFSCIGNAGNASPEWAYCLERAPHKWGYMAAFFFALCYIFVPVYTSILFKIIVKYICSFFSNFCRFLPYLNITNLYHRGCKVFKFGGHFCKIKVFALMLQL